MNLRTQKRTICLCEILDIDKIRSIIVSVPNELNVIVKTFSDKTQPDPDDMPGTGILSKSNFLP